jgi:hypothetical protein
LEEAVATLINTQAVFQPNMAAMQAETREIQRDTNEKFAHIMATLHRHQAILEALPETIRQKDRL